jgi:hypothetical protein
MVVEKCEELRRDGGREERREEGRRRRDQGPKILLKDTPQ